MVTEQNSPSVLLLSIHNVIMRAEHVVDQNHINRININMKSSQAQSYPFPMSQGIYAACPMFDFSARAARSKAMMLAKPNP